MEPEASTSIEGAPTATEDSMTIDYDVPKPADQADAPDDAEMGDDHHPSPAKDLTDLTAVEADMVDDETISVAQNGGHEPGMANGDVEIVVDEDAVTFDASSAAVDIPFSAPDAAPALPSALSVASTSVAGVDLLPGDPTLVAPAPEPEPIPTAPEPAHALVEAPAESAPAVEASSSLGDGGAAAAALQTLEETEPAGEAAPDAPTSAELVEELELVPNEDEATNEGFPETVIETAHEGEGESVGADADIAPQSEGDDTAQANEALAAPVVGPEAHEGVEASPAEASSSRPLINKDPLLEIEVPVRSPLDPSSSSRGVPAVFLSMGAPHGWTTYSLFHPEPRDPVDGDNDDEHVREDSVDLLLGDAAHHALYYEPLEALFHALRSELDFLGHAGDELVLEFDEIGLTITEVRLSVLLLPSLTPV